jgi:chromatin segregation and condensation protein Rec8/ScpA/Scc1 (kleisin family)
MFLKTILFVSFSLGLFFFGHEQGYSLPFRGKEKQAERKIEKQRRADNKAREKQRAKLIQEHIDRQTPEVQERMRQNLKHSKKWGRHSVPFYKKWYKKKPN